MQYISDWQGGMFQITRRDYETMPNVMMQVLRICQDVKGEVERKKAERAARGRQQS